jgi:HSP20 family protein
LDAGSGHFLSLLDERWYDWPSGLDVYETDKDVIVKAAVPGIPADKVEVTYGEGILRIRAKIEEVKEKKEKEQIVHSLQMKRSFNYATTLPRPIDEEKISAEVEDGVVTVTAPISGEASQKKIEVKVKGK